MKFTCKKRKGIKCANDLIEDIPRIRHEFLKAEAECPLWYRGQSDARNHKLVPKVGREHKYNGKKLDSFTLQKEKAILDRFRRHAYAFVEHALNEWEGLYLGRHHGLPTRLLDWTANPLVALYFACSCNQEVEGEIWAISRNKNDLIDVSAAFSGNSSKSPFDYGAKGGGSKKKKTQDAVKLLTGVSITPRIVSQRGVFTLHSQPAIPLDSYQDIEFETDNLDISALFRWSIPAKRKRAIVESLENFGVNRRSVFPDLDGLACELWETEVLWKGEKV